MKKTVAALAILSLVLIGESTIYGTERDPAVIISYPNERLSQLKNTDGVNTASAGNEVKLMGLKEEGRIITVAGSELILRSGEAIAIATDLRSLNGLTQGKGIKYAHQIKGDHSLVIPGNDGRDLLAKISALVLVRGSHSVK